MNDRPKGKCPHGEFYLDEGCPQCIEEARRQRKSTADPAPSEPGTDDAPPADIVKVQILNEAGEPAGREYSYFTAETLELGDVVQVPVSNPNSLFPDEHGVKAQVVAVNVPESEIAAFRNKVKTIVPGSKRPPTQVADFKPAAEDPATVALCVHWEIGNEREKPADAEEPAFPKENEFTTEVIDQLTDLPGPLLTLNSQDIGYSPDLLRVYNEANRLLEIAKARVISNNEDLKPATDDLAIIGKGKKTLLEVKKEIISPFRAKVDTVNAVFNELLAPLEEAEKITKSKMLAYDQIEKEKTALAEKEAAAKAGEITVPLGQETPKRTIMGLGTTTYRENWTFEITDFAKLPDEYKVADTAMLNSIARKHHDRKPVPGVRFFDKPIIATRTH